MAVFARDVRISWQDLFDAPNEELVDELRWALGRKASQSKGKSLDEVLYLDRPYLAALTAAEANFLEVAVSRLFQ
jgi:hypothetical protein